MLLSLYCQALVKGLISPAWCGGSTTFAASKPKLKKSRTDEISGEEEYLEPLPRLLLLLLAFVATASLLYPQAWSLSPGDVDHEDWPEIPEAVSGLRLSDGRFCPDEGLSWITDIKRLRWRRIMFELPRWHCLSILTIAKTGLFFSCEAQLNTVSKLIFSLFGRLMTTYDNLGQFMTTHDNSWQLMKTYENLWKLMTTYDNIWQLMKTYDSFRQLLLFTTMLYNMLYTMLYTMLYSRQPTFWVMS